jgi:hypothetical protein
VRSFKERKRFCFSDSLSDISIRFCSVISVTTPKLPLNWPFSSNKGLGDTSAKTLCPSFLNHESSYDPEVTFHSRVLGDIAENAQSAEGVVVGNDWRNEEFIGFARFRRMPFPTDPLPGRNLSVLTARSGLRKIMEILVALAAGHRSILPRDHGVKV